MAALAGRTGTLKKNAVVIAGVRTKTISWSGGSINVTSGEDAGIRQLLEESAEEQIDISFDGVSKASTIAVIALNGGTRILTDISLDLGHGVITGNFRLASYEEGLPYNDAVTFSASLESSGAWTYTAA